MKDRYIKKITEETCPDIGSERKIKTPKQSTVDVLDVVKCNVGGGWQRLRLTAAAAVGD